MYESYSTESEQRAARDAARVQQVVDQEDFDHIAAVRDAATRNLAMGAYDDATEESFENILDSVANAEFVLEYPQDLGDDEIALSGWLTDYRKRRARRKELRKQRRAERRRIRKLPRSQRKAARAAYRRMRKGHRKEIRTTRKTQRKSRRTKRKDKRDRKRSGISPTINAVSAEEAEAVTGEQGIVQVPEEQGGFPVKTIAIAGGIIAVVGIGVVAFMRRGKKKASK